MFDEELKFSFHVLFPPILYHITLIFMSVWYTHFLLLLHRKNQNVEGTRCYLHSKNGKLHVLYVHSLNICVANTYSFAK